jgi:hypothetical protein
MSMRKECALSCGKYDGWWVAIEPRHVTRASKWPYVRTVVVEFPSIDRAQQVLIGHCPISRTLLVAQILGALVSIRFLDLLLLNSGRLQASSP